MQFIIKCFMVLSLALALSAQANDTKVYKTVDKQGNPVFSDQPRQGAEPITLPPISTFNDPNMVGHSSMGGPQGVVGSSQIAQKYTSLSIIEPEANTSIWRGAGDLITKVDLTPPLAEGDTMQILLDGKLIHESQGKTTFQHTNVKRGEHTVKAQVVSSKGNILITSQPVTFYMHRAKVGGGG